MDIRVGTISSPRISPIRRRCRECRNDAGNRSAIDISPAGRPLGPVSPVPGRASMGTSNGYRGLVTPSSLVSKILCRKSSYSVSSVANLSNRSTHCASARRRVVFPAPGTPITRMDRRPRTAAYRKFAIDRDTMPMPISFSRVMST